MKNAVCGDFTEEIIIKRKKINGSRFCSKFVETNEYKEKL
jgi:hypothetical protein